MKGKLLIVLAIAIGFTMLFAGGASGASSKDCDDPRWQDHPSCQATSTTSTTTTTEPPMIPSCDEIPPIVVTQGGYFGIECEWTPAFDGEAPAGTVTATATGSVSWLVMVVRDSNPGDICVLEEWDRPSASVLEASFPLVSGNESYWESPVHWCSRFDGAAGTRDDLNGEPLNVVVNLRGKKGTIVEVSLDP